MAEPTPAPTQSSRLTVRSPDEILAMTFDQSHVILGNRILCRGQNACIVGPAGVGKSRLSLQMIVATVVGWKFIGFETHNPNLTWVILQVENDNRRLKDDLGFLRKWVGDTLWAKVNRQVFFHTLESDDDGFLTLDIPRNRSLVAQMINDLKPTGGVLWDSLLDYGFGDLNRDADMFASLSEMGRLTRLGDPQRIPLLLHHALTGKEGAAKALGWERAGYGRGSKALLMWTRLQINLAPGSEGGDVIVVGAGKCSDSKEFLPFAIRLNPATMIYEVEKDFDVRSWRSDVTRKNAPVITDTEVADLCGSNGMGKKELADNIMHITECSQASAYRAIERATNRHKVRYLEGSDRYVQSTAVGQASASGNLLREARVSGESDGEPDEVAEASIDQ